MIPSNKSSSNSTKPVAGPDDEQQTSPQRKDRLPRKSSCLAFNFDGPDTIPECQTSACPNNYLSELVSDKRPRVKPPHQLKDQLKNTINRSPHLGDGSYRKKQLGKSSPRKNNILRKQKTTNKRDEEIQKKCRALHLVNPPTLASGGCRRLFTSNREIISNRSQCRWTLQYSTNNVMIFHVLWHSKVWFCYHSFYFSCNIDCSGFYCPLEIFLALILGPILRYISFNDGFVVFELD